MPLPTGSSSRASIKPVKSHSGNNYISLSVIDYYKTLAASYANIANKAFDTGMQEHLHETRGDMSEHPSWSFLAPKLDIEYKQGSDGKMYIHYLVRGTRQDIAHATGLEYGDIANGARSFFRPAAIKRKDDLARRITKVIKEHTHA
jgi:hypothetical protein